MLQREREKERETETERQRNFERERERQRDRETLRERETVKGTERDILRIKRERRHREEESLTVHLPYDISSTKLSVKLTNEVSGQNTTCKHITHYHNYESGILHKSMFSVSQI